MRWPSVIETGKHLIHTELIFSPLYSILKYEQKPELYFWTCRISFFCLNLHIFIVKAYKYFITRHAIPTPECNDFMPWSFFYNPFDLRNSMCANESKCTYWPGKNIPWILNTVPCILIFNTRNLVGYIGYIISIFTHIFSLRW